MPKEAGCQAIFFNLRSKVILFRINATQLCQGMAMIALTMQDEKRIEVIQRRGDRFPDRSSHCFPANRSLMLWRFPAMFANPFNLASLFAPLVL